MSRIKSSKPAAVLAHGALRAFTAALLRRAGAPSSHARLVAASLVDASLRGVDSHGVQLVLDYVGQIEGGGVDPHGEGRVVHERGACLLYDGEHALGQVVSRICCEHAARLARRHGLGMVVARESSHFGAASYWARQIAGCGQLGIALCNASPHVAPWQGREGRLGTNPICMAVPGRPGKSWLLDMATTTVAMGKIYKAVWNHEKTIPLGWAIDERGVPTTDPEAALRGSLMPLGGYKGSGLAMLVEILCGVLGGGAMSSEVGWIKDRNRPTRASQMFLAVDVARFLPLREFRRRLARLVDEVRSARPAQGYSEVLVAGDPEERTEKQRRAEGIPISAGVWGEMLALARRLGVRPPAPM